MWKLLPPNPEILPKPSPNQLQAVETFSGITVVWGGPGTGKTSTLVSALRARISAGGQLKDYAVLASSRAAAQLIRRQVVSSTGKSQLAPVVTTVHGLALGIMRQYQADDEEPWTLLRAPQQEQRIRDLLNNSLVSWPEELKEAIPTKAFARQLRELLARIRQRSWDEKVVLALAADRQDKILHSVGEFFAEYLAVGDLEKAIDYAELIYRTRLFLRSAAANGLRERFAGIFVDDFQDLDGAQVDLLGDLALLGIPLTVFGDPQQIISGFRGASGNALKALLEFDRLKVVTLEDSWRHSKAVASGLSQLRSHISHHGVRLGFNSMAGSLGELTLTSYDDSLCEAHHTADQLRKVVARGHEWRDLAVITRAGRSQLIPLSRELVRLGIPIEFAAAEIVLAEDEAASIMLRLLKLSADADWPDDTDWGEILVSHLGGYDALDLRALARLGLSGGLWEQSIAQEAGDRWSRARQISAALTRARELLNAGYAVQLALWELWQATDWPETLRKSALAGQRRAHLQLDAIVELFYRAAAEPLLTGRSGALSFIKELMGEEISADTGREFSLRGTGVTLTTAHQAKGKQWEHVWVVGAEEGRWPRSSLPNLLLDPERLLDGIPRAIGDQVRDERRLFFLACSRARQTLHISGSAEEGMSRFARELGVSEQRITGRPTQPMTISALVGQLRSIAQDQSASVALRRGAAQRLARLAEAKVSSAQSATWWGTSAGDPRMVPQGKKLRLSGSAIEELLDCPRRYFLARKLGAGSQTNRTAAIGTLIHELAQQMQSAKLTIEQAIELLNSRWPELEFDAAWQSDTEHAAAQDCLRRLDRWLAQQTSQLLAAEQDFEVEIRVGDRPVVLRGRADRVDLTNRDGAAAVRIVDLKTMRVKPSAASLAENIQLGVYQLAVAEGAFNRISPENFTVAEPALLLLRHDSGSLPVLAEQSTLAAQPWPRKLVPDEHPSWIHSKIAQAAQILDAGEFPAEPGPSCRYCDFRLGCPAVRN